MYAQSRSRRRLLDRRRIHNLRHATTTRMAVAVGLVMSLSPHQVRPRRESVSDSQEENWSDNMERSRTESLHIICIIGAAVEIFSGSSRSAYIETYISEKRN